MDGNKNEFVVLKSSLVHITKLSEVCAQLVTIKGKPYIGLQRNSDRSEEAKENNHQIHKSILVPIEAWNTVICQAAPGLQKELDRIQPKVTIKEPKNSILKHLKKLQTKNPLLNNGMQTVLLCLNLIKELNFIK